MNASSSSAGGKHRGRYLPVLRLRQLVRSAQPRPIGERATICRIASTDALWWIHAVGRKVFVDFMHSRLQGLFGNRRFGLGIAQQLTRFATLQNEGEEVANPARERIESSITQLYATSSMGRRSAQPSDYHQIVASPHRRWDRNGPCWPFRFRWLAPRGAKAAVRE